MTVQLSAPPAPPAPPATTTPRSRAAAFGMAALLGPAIGGVLGIATFVVISVLAAVSSGGGVDPTTVLAVAFYSLWGFGVGALVGLVQAVVAISSVLLLQAHRNVTAARWVGALATLVLPALTIPEGWVPGILVPFVVASALAAACPMRLITRRRVTVGG